MNTYEQRLEARRQRLEARAERARQTAASAGATADRIAYVMNGQPVLIGHHSEKRHRRDIDRMQNAMHKSVHAYREAEELDRRADSVGTAGISSDDPDADNKLQARIAEMERERETMKTVNAAFRKAAKTGGDLAGWKAMAELVGESAAVQLAKHASYTADKVPYPSYTLTNLGANIRRLQERLKNLESSAGRETKEAIIGDARLIENAEENRVQLIFPGKPAEDIRSLLKSYGFRWSPTNGAWQRHLNASGIAAARQILVTWLNAPTSVGTGLDR